MQRYLSELQRDFQNHICTGTRQNPWLGQNLYRHPVLYESRNVSERAVRYLSVSHKTVHCINDLPNHLRSYGFKSDVWALGCVLYEMATLKHPFEANSLSALATKIMRGKYRMPSSSRYSSGFRCVSVARQNRRSR